MKKFTVIIPTWNAGDRFRLVLESMARQSVQPGRIIVIDSASTDDTVTTAVSFGCEVRSIPRHEFNHGATRQLAVDMAAADEFLLFLTQDSVPAHPEALETLLAEFADERVGAAYGRQLPCQKAGPLAAHSRIFNYPPQSRRKSLADKEKLGIKTAFMSNSFAAYRRSALMSVGGFPAGLVLGEDTFVAARMLLSGWEISYCAEARVFHSHEYSCLEQMHRYYKTGVFHGRQPWIRQSFGAAEGEGLRFVRSELRYLVRNGYKRYIPLALGNTACKFLAFRAGLWLK